MSTDVLEMGQYNKAMIEEPLTGFDLFLKEEHGLDKAHYWGQAVNKQIELEDEYYAAIKRPSKKTGCDECE